MKIYKVDCVAITHKTEVEQEANSYQEAVELVRERLFEEDGESVMGECWSDFPVPKVVEDIPKFLK